MDKNASDTAEARPQDSELDIWKKMGLLVAMTALFFAGITAYYAIQSTNIAFESLKIPSESQNIAIST